MKVFLFYFIFSSYNVFLPRTHVTYAKNKKKERFQRRKRETNALGQLLHSSYAVLTQLCQRRNQESVPHRPRRARRRKRSWMSMLSTWSLRSRPRALPRGLCVRFATKTLTKIKMQSFETVVTGSIELVLNIGSKLTILARCVAPRGHKLFPHKAIFDYPV